MAFFTDRASSKSDSIHAEQEVRTVLADYPDLFTKTEQNIDAYAQPDEKTLRINRDQAKSAAISVVAGRIQEPETYGVYDADKIAIEVAESYRLFLEDPKALLVAVSTQVRG